MANNCEICGSSFGTTNPRTFVQNHAVCKTCKSKIEKAGSFEAVKSAVEAEELERKKREELEELKRKKELLQETLRLKKLNEELRIGKITAAEETANYKSCPIIFSLEGSRGKHMDVYPDKCIITTSVTLGSIVTGNASDGEKTIYYSDIIGFQWKKSSLTLGYIQFETASRQMNNGDSNFFGENSFIYDGTSDLTDEAISEVIGYLKYRIDFIKHLSDNSSSPADEILKYKNLLDIGAITSEEYEAKKKQLLNL